MRTKKSDIDLAMFIVAIVLLAGILIGFKAISKFVGL
jgi:hypothetical protein